MLPCPMPYIFILIMMLYVNYMLIILRGERLECDNFIQFRSTYTSI